ncbi:hypothetical protein E2C01_013999 [Portunus trituberculatus]|uniref:Uncharacterized protein n=1 Tax=Portunus trituberculatus TaxID=210409 RepID=A0A5B7DIW6_PORTR|nr:hypothetical protein [Portunus trituberculatus]
MFGKTSQEVKSQEIHQQRHAQRRDNNFDKTNTAEGKSPSTDAINRATLAAGVCVFALQEEE